MRTVTPNIEYSESSKYWNLLKDLSEDVKIELISKLSTSLLKKREQENIPNWASEFSGAWKDSRTAEEIIEDVRNARTSNREIEL